MIKRQGRGVGIDRQLLEGLRRYEDAVLGFSEEFVEREGAQEALDIVARPTGETRTTGWVICPSLGRDQANLRRLEAMAARRLASDGFPILRLREGDTGLRSDDSVSARKDVAKHAVERLVDTAGVSRVGLIGALFGGLVAALVADELGLPLLVLWEPVVDGRRYLRDAFRLETIWDLAGTADGRPTKGSRSRRALEELEVTGRTTVRGLELTAETYSAISDLDLVQAIDDFTGRALIVSISPGGEPSAAHRRLAERLVSLGADATLTAIVNPLVAPFGEHYYRDEGLVRIDTRLELDRELTRTTAGWIAEAHGAGPA